MKIGLCYTKNSPAGKYVLNNFKLGMKKHNETIIEIHDFNSLEKYKYKIDIYVMFGWFSPSYSKFHKIKIDKSLRYAVYGLKKQVVVIDTGFIGGANYCSIGLNNIKGKANYGSIDCPEDRFKKLNLFIKDYKNNGNILILGQNRFGVSCSEIDIFKWHIKICRKTRELTEFPIIFRRHPREKEKQSKSDFPPYVKISKNEAIIDDFNKAKYCISYTTNGACQALLEGLYCITFSKQSMIYRCSDHDLNVLKTGPTNFTLEQRQKLFNWIAYCQWSHEELQQGICWDYVKNRILK